jgi:hypothetical protein
LRLEYSVVLLLSVLSNHPDQDDLGAGGIDHVVERTDVGGNVNAAVV